MNSLQLSYNWFVLGAKRSFVKLLFSHQTIADEITHESFECVAAVHSAFKFTVLGSYAAYFCLNTGLFKSLKEGGDEIYQNYCQFRIKIGRQVLTNTYASIIWIRKFCLQKVDNANAEKCAKVWNNQLTAQQPKKASHVQKVAQENFSMKFWGFGAG